MVSVAGHSRVPSLSSASTPSAAMQRRHTHPGCSVPAFRSDIHWEAAPANGGTAVVAESVGDSVVDLRLLQLAGETTSWKPESGKAADLLELSRDFSDFSSFNSDISGELERLAAISPPSHTQGADPTDLGFREGGGGISSLTSVELHQVITRDNLEPAVRSCVEILESSPSVEAKRSAAANLRLLAKHRSDFREVIGACRGAISSLVPLLRSSDPATQENTVTALLNLSLEECNKAPIAAAGAIKPLVYALKTGTVAAKQNAACALLSLSTVEDNRATIGACGAIPPLVSLLLHGSSRGKKDALATLYKLCATRRNKERAVSAGAVRPLVELVADRGAGTTEKAMVVLSSLAGVPEGRESIVEEGGIPALVDTIEEDGSVKGKEFAVTALLQLCTDSNRNRALLVREGAIPPLVALSQTGSTRARHKAETLLAYLREQRQGGVPAAIRDL